MPPPTASKRMSLKELKAHEEANSDPRPNTIVITGLPGAGKTTLAATMFSGEVAKRLTLSSDELAKAPWIELKGAVWIEADEQGLVALQAKKMRPEFVLSLPTLVNARNGNFPAALRDLHAYLAEAKEAGATGLVLDTVTSFGGQWLLPHYVDGSENGFAGWQSVAQEQTRILLAGQALGLRQVWLAQPTENKLETVAQSNKGTDLDKAKALSQSVSGGSNYVVPAISGKAFPPVLNAQCSISGWLRSRSVNGKRSRELLPFGGDGSQGKTRYEGILGEKEPADLWALDAKIMSVLGTDVGG